MQARITHKGTSPTCLCATLLSACNKPKCANSPFSQKTPAICKQIRKKTRALAQQAAAEQAVRADSTTAAFAAHCYDKEGRLVLKNLTLPQLEDWCLQQGEEKKRAMQIWRWLYADGFWMRSIEETAVKQNGFGKAFRDKFALQLSADGGLVLKNIATAADGTRKLVFELANGEGKGGTVETVLIPVVREQGQKSRITICISSQVGCAMNCQFCYTGRMGLLGNLTTAQIVEQVVFARRLLHEERVSAVGECSPITVATNIVFMGTGEPLHNLDAVLPAVDILCDPLGLHFSHNKVTLSTVGLVPELRRFSNHSRAQLAVSLHAPNNEIRDWIVPVNRRWPLAELLGTLRELYPKISADKWTDGQTDLQVDERRTDGHGARQEASCVNGNGTEQQHVGRPDRSGASAPAVDLSWQAVQKPPARRIGRHVLFEYVMLAGVNDSLECAQELLEATAGIEAKFNLIEFNPHSGTLFKGSSPDQIRAFRSVLIQGGRVCTIRNSRGDDEMAACGQLGNPDILSAAGRALPPLFDRPPAFQHVLQQQA